LLSIILLKQCSAVNISVFFSEPIAHFSLISIGRSMDSLETETGYTRKNKESMCRMFKRMLSRPMRRNKSDDCSKNIPAHGLFLCTNPLIFLSSFPNQLHIFHSSL
jgi:hypothetical protein